MQASVNRRRANSWPGAWTSSPRATIGPPRLNVGRTPTVGQTYRLHLIGGSRLLWTAEPHAPPSALTPLARSSSPRRRHVILPKELGKLIIKNRLLTEGEWRGIGVQQSRGWEHYAIHR
jgi:hypothetical protein